MHELFLILDAFGDRTQLITYLLEPLTSLSGQPSMVRAHYRDDIDVALISIAFPDGERDHLTRLRQLALRTGIKVIDPSELDDAGRRSFYTDQLAAYPIIVEEGNLAAALSGLSERLVPLRRRRDETVELGPRRNLRHPSSPGSYSLGRSRDCEADLPTKVYEPPRPFATGARGTRDAITAPPDDDPDGPKEGVDRGLARGTFSSNVQSVTARPPRVSSQSDAAGAPKLSEGPTDRITVQVSRGDEWVAARLRFLSVRRVEVAVTSTPQIGDPVMLSLAFRDCEVTVPGIVDRVARAPNLSTPVSTGFSAILANLSPPLQSSLLELLQRASDAGVRLAPPALRPVRFAVSWPLIVCPDGGEPLRVTALDVSLGGMFLHRRSLDSPLNFALPIDEGARSRPGLAGWGRSGPIDDARAPAIRGKIEVIREMVPEVASKLGFTPGTGVALRELASGDAERYERFVSRIRERNERRLVVAASSNRLAPLVTSLRGVGYTVTSSSDPAEVLELASSRMRPDVAVIDHSLTGLASETELLLSILREHHLFTLAIAGESVEDTRRAIDELLGIR